MPILAALGPSIPLLGPFFAFRVGAIVLFFTAVVRVRGDRQKSSVRTIAASFAISLVLFGLLGIFTKGATDAIWAELASVLAGAALVVSVLIMRDIFAALRYLALGWTFSYYFCAIIAAREIVLGVHWHTYFQLNNAASLGIASTFGNPNNYALYLLASTGMLAVGYAVSRRRLMRVVNFVALLSVPYFALETQSRLGTILTASALIIITIGYKATRRIAIGASVVAATVFALLYMSGRAPIFRDDILATGATGLYTIDLWGIEIPVDLSTFVRWNLTRNGLNYFAESPVLGRGPGSFEELATSGESAFPTFGMTNPHNGLVEILSQYGIVPAVFFVLWWLLLLTTAIRAIRTSDPASRSRIMALALLSFALTHPFSLVMNSSYIDPSSVWLSIAAYTMLALVCASLPFSEAPDRRSVPSQFAPGSSSAKARNAQFAGRNG